MHRRHRRERPERQSCFSSEFPDCASFLPLEKPVKAAIVGNFTSLNDVLLLFHRTFVPEEKAPYALRELQRRKQRLITTRASLISFLSPASRSESTSPVDRDVSYFFALITAGEGDRHPSSGHRQNR